MALLTAGAAAQRAGGLTGAPQVARVYDAIFDARFDQVAALHAQTCPPAPRQVCQTLDLVSLLWRIQLDPPDTSRDAQFQAQADAAVAAMEAWVQREPRRAEAWFYLGGASGARVQWRVMRGQQLAAARDGKRIKDSLERAVALDPGLQDAYFGIGLYHYYADVAPTAAKLLRWILLLPGGDRVKGMQEMLRARSGGQVLRSEADYQLHVLYLWYEKQPERALQLLTGLRARHPYNPHFLQLVAEVQDTYLHDLTASLDTWRALLESARGRRVAEPAMTEARARLGIALQLDRLFETDAAIEHLRTVIAARPGAPYGAVAQAQLQLGQALDRLGSRADALAAYRAALAAIPPGDPLKLQAPARAGLRTTPDTKTTTAYRLSLEGWRALERGAMAEAARSLTQSLALRPNDPVTRYRQARLLIAQGNEAAALPVLESLAAARDTTPPTIYAFACVEAARLHERGGRHPRALELYQSAASAFGAEQRTKDAAQRAAARLASSIPPPSR